MRGRRKATVGDIGVLVVVLVVFAIIAIMMYNLISSIYASSSGGTGGLNTEALYYGVAALKNMDFAIALLVAFFIIGLGAAAYSIKASPIILPLFLFLVVALVIVGAWFGNFFLSMFSSSDIAVKAQDFTLTTKIFSRLPLILGGAGLLIIAFLYFKPTVPGGGA
jgi:hypothetical protein